MDPRAAYEERLQRQRQLLADLQKRDDLYANLRLVAFVTAGGAAVAGLSGMVAGFVAAGVAGLGFLALVVAHDQVIRAKNARNVLIQHYERGLSRIDGTWHGEGRDGDAYDDADHPYASDLDLFGPASLFQLLSTARTAAGEATLAGWLLHPASVDEAKARQTSVRELEQRLDLREDLALLGTAVADDTHPQVLARWCAREGFITPTIRAVAGVLAAAMVITTALWLATPLGPWPIFVVALLQIPVYRRLGKRLLGLTGNLGVEELQVLASIMARLENEPGDSDKLRQLQARLRTDGQPASAHMHRLARLFSWIESDRNQLFAPVAFLLLWRVHFGAALENWRSQCAPHLPDWLAALGEIEALSALSNFAYEHPDFPLPEFSEATEWVGDAIIHPLMPDCVANSLHLTEKMPAKVVSGSNMSGKSTLLRTVGINTVLAQAGAPVAAKGLRLAPVNIGATLRIQDSLLLGKSRFFSEISRLLTVSEATQGDRPVLFLLDEILSGTNSHDRQTGAEAILRTFVERGAIGLITTHDLALARAADALAPKVENIHFEDHFEDGELAFDYTIRPGVVTKSNALELMRSIGLPVPD